MRGDHRGAQRLARWLLFAATAIGLVAMHSLGHGGGPVFPAAHTQTNVMAGPVLAADDDCAGDGCAHAAGPGHSGHHMANPSVCQAVLEAVGLLLFIVLLLIATVGHRRPHALTGYRRPSAARAPPRLPIGLTLSTVSVLRI